MKMKFDIQYRPRIESGKYGVETADGHPVRIICWDAMPDWPVCAMIKDYSPASTYGYPQLFDEDGKSINDRAKDLVIVIPDPELTEFETAYLRLVHRLSPGDILPEFVDESHLRENCMELMDIARRQFEPELLAAVMKGRKEALNMTAEDILNFKLSNPVAWASVIGPEIKAARIEGKEDALKDPKQEWSEDDERIRKISIGLLEILRSQGYATRESIDWLKSLRPQNWTKEDKERYISCLQRLGTGDPEQPETINSKWFKEHVYHQSQWKPSDEQMEALWNVYQGGKEQAELATLYTDLKILRNE